MARVFKAIKKNFQEISEGERIGGGLVFKPAPYLPIVEYNDFERLDIVMKSGTIVALDQFGYLVPANGGDNTVKLTYSAMDASSGVYDYDTFTGAITDPIVAAPKTTTKSLNANSPIGVLPYDVFRWDMNADPMYKVQTNVALLEDWLILVPLTSAMQTAHAVGAALNEYHSGGFVASGSNGEFVPFVATTEDIAATGTAYNVTNLEQRVGKIIKVEDVTTDPNFTGGYENVVAVPGLGLGGKENGGLPHGIDSTTKKGLFVQLQF